MLASFSLFLLATGAMAQSTATVPVPSSAGKTQEGLTYNPSSVMISAFGNPCSLAAAGHCKTLSNAKLSASIVKARVGRFCATGLAAYLARARRGVASLWRDNAALADSLGTAGVLCCRAISGTSTYSNHAWGGAMDVTVAGVLDTYGDGKVQQGLVDLFPHMRAQGLYWGAGFPTEDGMHFELSRQLADELIASGEMFDVAKSFPTDNLRSLAGCSWPVVRNGADPEDKELSRAVQYLLKWNCESLTVDGAFGPTSASKATSFQASRGLVADGIVGRNTYAQLFDEVQEASGAKGDSDLVRALQVLLNRAKAKSPSASALVEVTVDGSFGPGTTAAVKAFQGHSGLSRNGILDFATFHALIEGSGTCAGGSSTPVPTATATATATPTPTSSASVAPTPTSTLTPTPTPTPTATPTPTPTATTSPPPDAVPPVSTTPSALTPSSTVSDAQLRCVMPRLSSVQASAFGPALRQALRGFGTVSAIDTTMRISAFLAQIAHESGELRYWTELGNYCTNYEGRKDLGNTQKGDGCRFKGRGPLQLTGRANYQRAGDDLGLNLVGDPESVAESENGFKTAVWFWSVRRLNAYADVGDFNAITRRINGGYNGKADRERYYLKAKSCLGGVEDASSDGRQWREVRRGASGPVVKAVQLLLLMRGHLDDLQDVDGDFGPRTERALRSFQMDNKLPIDGVVGASSWVSLIVTAKRGDAEQPAARAIQTLLSEQFGYKVDVDGAFGPGTESTVKEFQAALELSVDGVVGAGTWNALVTATPPNADAYALVVEADGVTVSSTYTTDTASVDDVLGPEVPAAQSNSPTDEPAGKDAEESSSKTPMIIGLVAAPVCLAVGVVGGFLIGKRKGAASGSGDGRTRI